jgi:hypothetical protein
MITVFLLGDCLPSEKNHDLMHLAFEDNGMNIHRRRQLSLLLELLLLRSYNPLGG